MCWTKEVSAGFAAFEFAVIAILIFRRAKHDWQALPLLVTICLVEALEVIMWQFVEPVSSLHTGEGQCHQMTRAAVVVVFVAIAGQPYFINAFMANTNTDPRKAPLFLFTRITAGIIWLLYLASLAVGELWGLTTATVEFAREQQVCRLPGLQSVPGVPPYEPVCEQQQCSPQAPRVLALCRASKVCGATRPAPTLGRTATCSGPGSCRCMRWPPMRSPTSS